MLCWANLKIFVSKRKFGQTFTTVSFSQWLCVGLLVVLICWQWIQTEICHMICVKIQSLWTILRQQWLNRVCLWSFKTSLVICLILGFGCNCWDYFIVCSVVFVESAPQTQCSLVQCWLIVQEAQLLQRDRVTHYVSKFAPSITCYGSYKGFSQLKWPSRSFKSIGNGVIR